MNGIRILIADDLKAWRSMLRSELETNSQFQVVAEAGNGCEAIEKAAQFHPDIVLLDIGMPLLNGLEAAPTIRQASPASKIIFLTQLHDEEIRAAALATGAVDYLLKSDAGELPSVIHAAVGTTPPLQALSPSFIVV